MTFDLTIYKFNHFGEINKLIVEKLFQNQIFRKKLLSNVSQNTNIKLRLRILSNMIIEGLYLDE